MPNTQTYWSLNGVSLHEFAWSVQTIGGSLSGVPSSRGENITIPGRPGTIHSPKVPDERILSLQMFVIGMPVSGTFSGKPTVDYDKNYAALKRLFYSTTRKRGVLTKRFYDDTGTLRTASADVEFTGGLSPDMTGRARSTFYVDLRLADPFFYSPVQTAVLTSGNNTISYAGDAPSRKLKLILTGTRGPVTFWNRGLGMNVQTVDTIGSGTTTTIDVDNYTSRTQTGSGAAINTIGSIRHAGSAAWLELDYDNKVIEAIVTTGSGAMTLEYQEAWL